MQMESMGTGGQARMGPPAPAALPPPLPPAAHMRPTSQPAPSNLSLDHILMLANLTNSPADFSSPSNAGAGGGSLLFSGPVIPLPAAGWFLSFSFLQKMH
jgi:hypothetical protein